MIKNITNKLQFNPVLLLIVVSFFSRSLTAYFFGDKGFENEWSTLLYNLVNYSTYSFFQFNGELIPSIYMPPAYTFFLYLIKFATIEKINFLNSVIIAQIIISTLSVYIFYEINKNLFSSKLALINAFVFALIPLNLYSVGQVSSINLQLFFSLLFIKYFFYLLESKSKRDLVMFSIVVGLLLLTRGEFMLILFATFIYSLIYKKINLKSFIAIFIISGLIISPYVLRNYSTFGQITIVKSIGYNLWKGNNQLSLSEGAGFSPIISFDDPNLNFELPVLQSLKNRINNIEKGKLYEIKRDKIFLQEAIKNISSDPIRYLNLFIKKVFSYFFIDLNSNYPNYYNLFHFVPITLVSILSFPGIIIALKKNSFKINYLLFYLFLNILIFSSFFILPRYKLTILPIQIILASLFLSFLYKRFFSKIKNTI